MYVLLLSRTTLQSLYQATENARQNNYYVGGLSHTWMTFYQSQLTEDYLIRNEWYVHVHVYTLYMYHTHTCTFIHVHVYNNSCTYLYYYNSSVYVGSMSVVHVSTMYMKECSL